jgi:hypothetical protein
MLGNVAPRSVLLQWHGCSPLVLESPRSARRYGRSQSSAAVLRSMVSVATPVAMWFVFFRRQCLELSRGDQVSKVGVSRQFCRATETERSSYTWVSFLSTAFGSSPPLSFSIQTLYSLRSLSFPSDGLSVG